MLELVDSLKAREVKYQGRKATVHVVIAQTKGLTIGGPTKAAVASS